MKINLMIHGLAAFLPQPFEGPTNVRILIPDVRTEVEREGMTVCAHSSTLILPNGDHWDLDGERIEITGGVGDPEITQSFLDGMSDMKRIAPGSETVAPSYLASPPVPPPGRVPLVADLNLTSGRFSITDGAPKRRMAFRVDEDTDPVLEGEFAEFVQILIEVPGGKATLTTKRFVGGTKTHQEDFEGGPNDIIDVIIKNICDRPDDRSKLDKDFIIYYDFSHEFLGARVIPYPLPLVPPPPAAAATGVNASAFGSGGCIAGLFHQ